MNATQFSHALGKVNDKYIMEAITYKKEKRSGWLKWCAMAACLCLIVSGVLLLKQTTENNNVGNGDGIVMLFTEAKVIKVLSPRSVLVEVTEENIYNANTDKNLFHVGDIVQAEFNEDILLKSVEVIPQQLIIRRNHTLHNAIASKLKRRKITEIFGSVQRITWEQKEQDFFLRKIRMANIW